MLIQGLGWSADAIQGSAWPRHLVGHRQRWSRQPRNKNFPHLFENNIEERKRWFSCLGFQELAHVFRQHLEGKIYKYTHTNCSVQGLCTHTESLEHLYSI